MKRDVLRKQDIDVIVYDFDGVMTDNRVIVFQDGTEAVCCNRSDGLAIQLLAEHKVRQVILSTESNPVVRARAKKLKIPVYDNVKDKKAALIDYCKNNGFSLSRVVYFGNDSNDIEAMRMVGYPIAPCDADTKVKKVAKIVTKKKGGEGVIKEFFEDLITF